LGLASPSSSSPSPPTTRPPPPQVLLRFGAPPKSQLALLFLLACRVCDSACDCARELGRRAGFCWSRTATEMLLQF
jgi:hypothetical protein